MLVSTSASSMGTSTKISAVSALMVLFFAASVRDADSQSGEDCVRIIAADLGDELSPQPTGLIYLSLGTLFQDSQFPVQLLDFNIVCSAQGSRRDRYRSVSVIAQFITTISPTPDLRQFHYYCQNNAWTTFSNSFMSVSISQLVGNLTTPERQDCRVCTDLITGFTMAEHCVGELSRVII